MTASTRIIPLQIEQSPV